MMKINDNVNIAKSAYLFLLFIWHTGIIRPSIKHKDNFLLGQPRTKMVKPYHILVVRCKLSEKASAYLLSQMPSACSPAFATALMMAALHR